MLRVCGGVSRSVTLGLPGCLHEQHPLPADTRPTKPPTVFKMEQNLALFPAAAQGAPPRGLPLRSLTAGGRSASRSPASRAGIRVQGRVGSARERRAEKMLGRRGHSPRRAAPSSQPAAQRMHLAPDRTQPSLAIAKTLGAMPSHQIVQKVQRPGPSRAGEAPCPGRR